MAEVHQLEIFPINNPRMNKIPDYIEMLGVRLRTSEIGCGISLRNRDDSAFHAGALFEGVGPQELRARFNEAMQMAVEHYTRSAGQAGVEFTPLEIKEISFRVVLYVLIHRHIDSRANGVETTDWSFKTTDLVGGAADSLCWVYCETMFSADYARRTAGLTGMSLDAFKQYEKARRPLMQDMGLLSS
jgi:hypothetical protein